MLTTTVVFAGNLATDPELRFTTSGKLVTDLVVLVNERRRDEAGEWNDTEPTRHIVKVFGPQAENVAETTRRGDRVMVAGTVTTETWNDKDTGDKRTKQVVLADEVAESLRWTSARILKPQRADHA